MIKKIIVLLILLVVLLVSFSLLAFAKDAVNPALSEPAEKALKKADGLTPEQIKYKQKCLLLEKVKQYGIDINGLTDEQLEEIVAAKDEEMIAKAKRAGIDTDGLTPEQVIEKVNEIVYPALSEPAEIALKKDDGLTPEQIKYKQKCLLLEKAKQYGIDINGLTEEQLEEIVAANDEEMIAKANRAGIDTDGLTPEQVIEKVNESDKELPIKRAEKEKKFILEQADWYGIDTTGLSFEQIKAKVYEILMPALVEKAKELGINSTGLGYSELLLKLKMKDS